MWHGYEVIAGGAAVMDRICYLLVVTASKQCRLEWPLPKPPLTIFPKRWAEPVSAATAIRPERSFRVAPPQACAKIFAFVSSQTLARIRQHRHVRRNQLRHRIAQ